MTTYPVGLRRWTRAEYDRLIDVGILRPGDPVELLGGELMVAEPQGSRHYTAIGLVEEALRATFGVGWVIRSQGPVALDDYWIVNLVERVLEIYREPVADPSATYGWRYASRTVLGRDASASPLAAPTASIVVHALLP